MLSCKSITSLDINEILHKDYNTSFNIKKKDKIKEIRDAIESLNKNDKSDKE